jgi:hypothetical protein
LASDRYIRVTRGDIGPGTVDPGYPKTISELGWGNFDRLNSARVRVESYWDSE